MINEIDGMNVDPQVTFNIGRIEGGGALNMVPDLAIGRVNVRVMDDAQRKQVEADFAELVERYTAKDGYRVEMHGAFYSPPKPMDDATAAIQRRVEACGSALGMDIQWRASGGASDGNKFAAAGLPNIDTLGAIGGNIHSSDEYILLDSLVSRTKLTGLLLLSLAAEN